MKFDTDRLDWMFQMAERFQAFGTTILQPNQSMLGGNYMILKIDRFERYPGAKPETVFLFESALTGNATYSVVGRLANAPDDFVARRYRKSTVRGLHLAVRTTHNSENMQTHDILHWENYNRIIDELDAAEARRAGLPEPEPHTPPPRTRLHKTADRVGSEGATPAPEIPFEEVRTLIDSLDNVPPDNSKFKAYLRDEERFFEEFEVSLEEQRRNPLIPDYERRMRFFPERPETKENFLNLFRDMRAHRADPEAEKGPYLTEALRLYNNGEDKRWDQFVAYTDELFVRMDHLLAQQDQYDRLHSYYNTLQSSTAANKEDKLEELRLAIDHPLGLRGFKVYIDERINELLDQFEAAMGIQNFDIRPSRFYKDEREMRRRR